MAPQSLKVIYHDLYLTDYPTASCETPERVASIMQVLKEHYKVIEPAACSEDDILLVHTQSILKAVRNDPYLYDAAAMAVGGALKAADLALSGQPVFAALRPPGHHASPGSHWGFCFFNNVAISVEKMLCQGKISQALILDIDLHFGDGTENFFMGRRGVIVANIQENRRETFLEKVDLALSRNRYDVVVISAGFDRHMQDWGGTLTTEDYFAIGRSVREYAEAECAGHYYAVLEGGYNTGVLGENALALCRGMDPDN